MAERRGKQTSRVPYADAPSDAPAGETVMEAASFDPAAFADTIDKPATAIVAEAVSAETAIVDATPAPAPEAEVPAPMPAPADIPAAFAAAPETIDPLPLSPTLSAPPVMAAPFLKGFIKMATAPEMTYAATDKLQSMFGDVNERTKTAVEKTSKMAEDFTELTKGNVEALVASGRVAAKGAEAMTHEVAEYSKKSFEHATGALKSFAAVKSPTELFQLQSEFAKSSFESMFAEASKVSESMLKLMGEIAQPLSTRYAVAAEKLKVTTSL